MNFIESFINDFINNNQSYLYTINSSGYHFPFLLPFIIFIYFISLTIYLYFKNNKSDNFSLKSLLPSIIIFSLVYSMLILFLTLKITEPIDKEIKDMFAISFNNEIHKLENSKKIEDNIKFVSILNELKKDNNDIEINIFIQNFYKNSKIYKDKFQYYNINNYLIKRFIETKNLNFIRYFFEHVDTTNYKYTKKFKNIIIKEICPNTSKYHTLSNCDLELLFKNKWIFNYNLLDFNKEMNIKISYSLPKCEGYEYLFKEYMILRDYRKEEKEEYLKILNQLNNSNECSSIKIEDLNVSLEDSYKYKYKKLY